MAPRISLQDNTTVGIGDWVWIMNEDDADRTIYGQVVGFSDGSVTIKSDNCQSSERFSYNSVYADHGAMVEEQNRLIGDQIDGLRNKIEKLKFTLDVINGKTVRKPKTGGK